MSIDWNLFWHMGGHGAYVWGGWGLAALALGAEFFALWRRTRRLPAPGAVAARGVGTARGGDASAPERAANAVSGRNAESGP